MNDAAVRHQAAPNCRSRCGVSWKITYHHHQQQISRADCQMDHLGTVVLSTDVRPVTALYCWYTVYTAARSHLDICQTNCWLILRALTFLHTPIRASWTARA